jgi:hypothetical protein
MMMTTGPSRGAARLTRPSKPLPHDRTRRPQVPSSASISPRKRGSSSRSGCGPAPRSSSRIRVSATKPASTPTSSCSPASCAIAIWPSRQAFAATTPKACAITPRPCVLSHHPRSGPGCTELAARFRAVDTSSFASRPSGRSLCLIQVAGPDHEAIIDPLAPAST